MSDSVEELKSLLKQEHLTHEIVIKCSTIFLNADLELFQTLVSIMKEHLSSLCDGKKANAQIVYPFYICNDVFFKLQKNNADFTSYERKMNLFKQVIIDPQTFSNIPVGNLRIKYCQDILKTLRIWKNNNFLEVSTINELLAVFQKKEEELRMNIEQENRFDFSLAEMMNLIGNQREFIKISKSIQKLEETKQLQENGDER